MRLLLDGQRGSRGSAGEGVWEDVWFAKSFVQQVHIQTLSPCRAHVLQAPRVGAEGQHVAKEGQEVSVVI